MTTVTTLAITGVEAVTDVSPTKKKRSLGDIFGIKKRPHTLKWDLNRVTDGLESGSICHRRCHRLELLGVTFEADRSSSIVIYSGFAYLVPALDIVS